MELIIQLIAGVIGGNAAGAALKNLSLGPLGNSIAGVIGGGIGGQLLAMMGGTSMVDAAGAVQGMDIASIVKSLVGGGVGGAVVMAIVGAIKNAVAK